MSGALGDIEVVKCRARALQHERPYHRKHTGPSYKPYCMPSLTVALLLLEWLHDGVYAGQCWGIARAYTNTTHTNTTTRVRKDQVG